MKIREDKRPNMEEGGEPGDNNMIILKHKTKSQLNSLKTKITQAKGQYKIVEDAYKVISEKYQKMEELAEEACSGLMGDNVRYFLNHNFKPLVESIDRIPTFINYEGIPPFKRHIWQKI